MSKRNRVKRSTPPATDLKRAGSPGKFDMPAVQGMLGQRTFHVIAKPAGPTCNLDCRWGYYLSKETLAGRKAPRGFILMTACGTPPLTPPKNFNMINKAVRDGLIQTLAENRSQS